MLKLLLLTALFALLVGVSGVPAWAQQSTADQVFAQLDTDRDGKLSQAEFAGHPDLTSDMFGKWDTNGDKYISKQEFLANYDKE